MRLACLVAADLRLPLLPNEVPLLAGSWNRGHCLASPQAQRCQLNTRMERQAALRNAPWELQCFLRPPLHKQDSLLPVVWCKTMLSLTCSLMLPAFLGKGQQHRQQQLNQRLLDRLTPFAGAGSVGLSASAASAVTAVRWATALREAL